MVVIALLFTGQAQAHMPFASLQSGKEPPQYEQQAAKVIRKLDVGSLASGLHRFYFQISTPGDAEPVDIPVLVLKGERDGPRLLLTAAIHGDELNGIAVIHQLFSELDSRSLAGAIVAVPGVNQSGIKANSRYFADERAPKVRHDLNRLFPGKISATTAADRFVGALWQGLLKNNADLVVDLHTQTTGLVYPLFVFADFRNNDAKQMAYALLPEMIKNDKGEKGALETTFIANNIPAVTLEIGAPKSFQPDMVTKATAGIVNLLRTKNLLAGEPVKPEKAPYLGTRFKDIFATRTGPVRFAVELGQDVMKGDLLAVSHDAFGVEQKWYHSPVAGRVVSIATNPIRPSGALLVRVLH